MATEVERLSVTIEATLAKFDRDMRAAVGISNKQFRAIEKRGEAMTKRLDGLGSNIFRGASAPLAGLAGALGIREIQQYADAWTQAGNKVRAAGQSAGVQTRSIEDLKDAANTARADLSSYVDLYAALTRSTKGIAKSEQEVADATNIVAKAFKAGGAGAAEQASGILQLGQALGSGVLQGDELRSLLENAPVLAQLIAKEFNVSISQLKKLGADGVLVSNRVFSAILKGGAAIEEQFAATNATIGDAMTRIENEFIAYIGLADQSAGASQKLVQALQYVADNFKGLADGAVQLATIIIGALTGRAIAGMIITTVQAAGALATFITAVRTGTVVAGGLVAVLGPLGLLVGAAAAAVVLFADSQTDAEAASNASAGALKELSFQIDNVDYSNSAAVSSTRQKIAADIDAARTALARAKAERELAAAIIRDEVDPQMGLLPAPRATDVENTINESPTVKDRQALIDVTERQLADLEAAQKKFEEFASGKAKPTRQGDLPVSSSPAGAGSGKTKKTKKGSANEWEREVQQINEQTAAIQAETAAQATLNPLINDYGFTLAKARAEQDLLTAAKRAGVEVTPQLRQQIGLLATSYAQATAEAAKLDEAQDKARQRAEEMRDLGKDVLGGFISDMKSGVSAADALSNALDKIADKLLDMALSSLFDGGGGGSFLDIFKGIGSLFGGARASGGPVSANKAYLVGEKGPELIVPRGSGNVISNRELTSSTRQVAGAADSRGAAPSISNVYSIDARGAQAGVGEEIRRALAAYDKGTVARTAAAIRDANRRSIR